MRRFMSSNIAQSLTQPVNTPTTPAPAAECAGCNSTGVKSAGEDISAVTPKVDPDTQSQVSEENQQKQPEATVVMSGPLGAVVTEALNKQYKKVSTGAGIALETLADEMLVEYAADGKRTDEVVARMRKSVGLVPATDDVPTTVNALLDAASRVRDIDFIVTRETTMPPEGSKLVQTQRVSTSSAAALEGYEVGSVSVVVHMRKKH